MEDFLEIISLVEEISAAVTAMKADGSFTSFEAAVATAEKEFQTPAIQALVVKVEALFAKKA